MSKVAPMLLGWELSSGSGAGIVTVRLTEVEAYAGSGGDAASHAHRGPTKRNAVMFGPPGHLYAYFVYGMHWCLNVVTGPAGYASAVLLRAGEVVAGEEQARSRRGDAVPLKDLARGPARLAAALGLDGSCTGVDLLDPQAQVRLSPPAAPPVGQIMTGPRIGISRDIDRPWRFWLAGEPTVSGPVSGRG